MTQVFGFFAMAKDDQLLETKRLMAALGRMPPKHHSEMKVGRSKPKTAKRVTKRKKA
jgi:hypothetical protein